MGPWKTGGEESRTRFLGRQIRPVIPVRFIGIAPLGVQWPRLVQTGKVPGSQVRCWSSQATNFAGLFNGTSPLVDCYSLPAFDGGNRPGTFDSFGLRNRLDYILTPQSLQSTFTRGGVFRKGLWGSRASRPTGWVTYPEITESTEQVSRSHSSVY